MASRRTNTTLLPRQHWLLVTSSPVLTQSSALLLMISIVSPSPRTGCQVRAHGVAQTLRDCRRETGGAGRERALVDLENTRLYRPLTTLLVIIAAALNEHSSGDFSETSPTKSRIRPGGMAQKKTTLLRLCFKNRVQPAWNTDHHFAFKKRRKKKEIKKYNHFWMTLNLVSNFCNVIWYI